MSNQNEQTSSSWLLPSAEGFSLNTFANLNNDLGELKIQISEINSYQNEVEAIDRADDDFTDLVTYVNFGETTFEKLERAADVSNFYTKSCAIKNSKSPRLNMLTGGGYFHCKTNQIREILYSELVDSCNQKLASIKDKAISNYKSFLTGSPYFLGLKSDGSLVVASLFEQILKKLSKIEKQLEQAQRLLSISVNTRELSTDGKRLFLSEENLETLEKLVKKFSRVKKFINKLITRIELS